ncbi:MAG: hypothetical protein Q9216_000470 [Gyalolechia sp. 2 TL-2023]
MDDSPSLNTVKTEDNAAATLGLENLKLANEASRNQIPQMAKKNKTAKKASQAKNKDGSSSQVANRCCPDPQAPDYRPLKIPPLGSAQPVRPPPNERSVAVRYGPSGSLNGWNKPTLVQIAEASSPSISPSSRSALSRKPKSSVSLGRNVPLWRIDKLHRSSTSQVRPNVLPTATPPTQPLRRWLDSAPTVQPSPQKPHSSFSAAAAKSPPTPVPDATYLSQSTIPALQLNSSQPLLIVLDLNGTLLYRPKASSGYKPRPYLKQFLAHCNSNYKILVWSSATPRNVTAICAKIFTPEQRKFLLGEWGRDTLDLTLQQYKAKVQVYKRLDRIWAFDKIQRSHPDYAFGGRWSQKNTLLLDDSTMKASAQPYNSVVVPEFVKGAGELQINGTDVLGQVVAYLELAKTYQDVSAFARERPFRINEGWRWDWSQKGVPASDFTGESDEDIKGGVRL